MNAPTDFALTVPGTDYALSVHGDQLVGNGQTFSRIGAPADRRRPGARAARERGAQLDNVPSADAHGGVWELTRVDRRTRLDKFAQEYAAVRAAEQREVRADEACLLPLTSDQHPLAAMWRERAASHARFEAAIAQIAPGLAIDVGAGCGWLGARLMAGGWRCAALDITVEGGDGLASATHHDADLLLVRAEMESLPFASSSIDLAVFNASLHYATDVRPTLEEAIRVLAPGGTLVVLDSPVYSDPCAGHAMVREFAAEVREAHALPAATHAGPGFIAQADLESFAFDRSGDEPGLRGRLHRWTGARRAGREIASRPLLVAKMEGQR